MTRLAFTLLTLPVLLSFLASAQAGPACAKRNQDSTDCVEACKGKWGWPGFAMNTDRWGSVGSATGTSTDALTAAVTKGCRVRTRSSSALSSATAPTSSATLVGNVALTASASTASAAVTSSASIAPLANSSSAINATLFHSSTASSSHKLTALANTVSSTSTSSSKPSTTSTKPETTSTTPKTTSTSKKEETTEAPPTTSAKPSTSTKKASTTKQAQTTQSSGNSGSSSSDATSQSDINAYLTAHNSVRSQHGASALSWSDDLAASAQTWANNCVFQHSGGKLGAFGENLAAGTGSSYGISTASSRGLTKFVTDYSSSNPQASHFTQVVWKATTQVGCAVQSCGGIFDASFGPAKYYVCEYFPQGNVIGAFAQNVQA
ncbi:PR-1-like protein [Epithele typhae]|uniref:PR-1-like protein n=1 Tax=Epithele typhae TaxID=378194 RepID=UPI0020077848|nr:PR-1-like protein [Epithele typhae]KAH9944449.1 PR-1-like protein [Epithele typhae]